MKLSPDDLKRIAHLARIAVTDADVAVLQTQLNGIFGLIDELQAVDTKGVEPLSHPLDVIHDMAQRLREDRITEVDQREANMTNAPAQENGLFLVPKVLD
jgi:aspartyl-tRNA(Asn)/glutamyl-tRNA(Gln) amidotransferase subunit C